MNFKTKNLVNINKIKIKIAIYYVNSLVKIALCKECALLIYYT